MKNDFKKRCLWLLTIVLLSAILTPTLSMAAGSAKDFVRSQAGRAAILTDVSKIQFIAGEIFRFETLALLRMTHTDWKFPNDDFFKDRGQSYAYKIRAASADAEYDAAQISLAIKRNKSVTPEQKTIALDLLEQLQKLIKSAKIMGELYDAGDPVPAGHFYYTEIYPVYEALRRGAASISSETGREIKIRALKFK